MSKTLIENKSAMLKDLKKAVNSLVYSPSLAKQEAAFDALASLNNFLESFEIPKEVKSAKKPKATKPLLNQRLLGSQRLLRQKQFVVLKGRQLMVLS
jgi:hypothetical protein